MPNPRAEYSPIHHRPALRLPDNARIAVWPVVNVEEWDINSPMARTVLPTPQGVATLPDIPNYSWFDYGLRVGFWRMKTVLDRHDIRATLSVNAAVCNHYPQIIRETVESGWEMLGHGFIQRVMNLEKDERDVIRRSLETIEAASGKKPRGWMGPGLGETFETPDLLAEEGIEYVCDWVNDDQPYYMKVRSGTLVSIPYTVELNDIPIHIVQHHRSRELMDRAIDAFDTLYQEGAESARVICVSTHPYITGAAHRIRYYDELWRYIKGHPGVWFCTGSEILDWYVAQTGGPSK